MRGKPLSLVTEDKIIALYHQGHSSPGVAKIAKVSLQTVYNVLKRRKVPKLPMRSRLTRRYGRNALDWFDDDIIH